MSLSSLVKQLYSILNNKQYTIITKAQTTLGVEGKDTKNILSPHDGGYILIRW